MQTITLPGSIRSKKNSKIATMVGGVNKPRRAIILSSKAYTKWEKVARVAAKEQWQGPPLSGPVAVTVTVYYKGAQPDLSGCLESVGDALEGLCWMDDKLIMSWDGSRLCHDLKSPRTEVYVFDFDVETQHIF